MLNDARGFSRIVVACGKTDLRKGIDGLAAVVEGRLRLNPGEKNVLFLFCGTRPDRIKGLVFEGDAASSYISGWTTAGSAGPATNRRP